MAEKHGSSAAGGGEEIAAAEREIHKHVKELHDKGVIDLDAPTRDVIEVIQRQFPASRSLKPKAGGYWLVGDQGWCDHLT